MALIDAAGTIVRTNLRIASLLGMAPNDIVAQHWSAFVGEVDREPVDIALGQLLEGKRALLPSPDYAFERPDGQLAHFRASTSALREPADSGLLLVQLTDLGEEQRARQAVAGLVERHDQIAAVLGSSRQAILATDAGGVVTMWNAAMADLLGWPADEVIGRPLSRLFPGGGRQTNDLVDETVRGDEIPKFATFFPRSDGAHIAVDCDVARVVDTEGTAIGMSCMIVPHDAEAPDARLRWIATQQRLLTRMRQLISQNTHREEIEEGILTAIASMSFSTHVVISDLRDDGETLRLRTALGWEPGTLPVVDVVHDDTLVGHAVRNAKLSIVEDWSQTDISLPASLAAEGVQSGLALPLVAGGKVIGGVCAYRQYTGEWAPDVIEFAEEIVRTYGDALARWDAETERRRLELHDQLTGLPGLSLLLDRLQQTVERDRALGLATAVLAFDIDHFRRINETGGHDTGDRLLKAIVPRLQSVVRFGDTIGRLSGDAFVIVLGELDDESSAMLTAEAVLEAFAEPFVVNGEDHVVGVSIGITIAHDAATPQELLGDADAALFRAKELGRGRIEAFDRELRERVTQRVRTERELRGAVERGELSLRYQPIVDLRSGEVEAVEALVRWQHPDRGLVSPIDFIQVAEESGLIVPLGEWVLETACRQGAEWLKTMTFPRPLQISVNLSARQLAAPGVRTRITETLQRTGLPATNLSLEVTESVLIEQEDAVEILTDLRKQGVRIMLDDFGTGYSSLSYLRRFEVDALKIDRSFVTELGERRQDALIVAALVQMAAALGIDAVAEGVETAQQAQLLRVLGCELAQGFHFARPLPADQATAMLERMVPQKGTN